MMYLCQDLYSLFLLVVKKEYFNVLHNKIFAEVFEITVVNNERLLLTEGL